MEKEWLTIEIVLMRPGMLIGKSGRTIDALSKYLKEYNMNVAITESKLWNRIK